MFKTVVARRLRQGARVGLIAGVGRGAPQSAGVECGRLLCWAERPGSAKSGPKMTSSDAAHLHIRPKIDRKEMFSLFIFVSAVSGQIFNVVCTG